MRFAHFLVIIGAAALIIGFLANSEAFLIVGVVLLAIGIIRA